MRVKILGSTGSIASPGPDNVRYGGNTSSLHVMNDDGDHLLLDGGTGLREAGHTYPAEGAVHIVMTHLHIDHVHGLGFFRPLFQPGREVHLWGPATADHSFEEQLTVFFSQPLFPVEIPRLPAHVEVHDLPTGPFELPGFVVEAVPVAHPGPTVGILVSADEVSVAYLPDHEPGFRHTEVDDDSGAVRMCTGADLLVHDVMYLDADYVATKGFGHSSVGSAAEFVAGLSDLGTLVPFHQDPSYDDDTRDTLMEQLTDALPGVRMQPPHEGLTIVVSSHR